MKKLLVLMLTVVMLLSLGIVASATEENENTVVASEGAAAKVGNTEYATIDEAIAAWTNGTTLTLLKDVTLSDVITIVSTESRVLNLGTYTMTAASGKNAIQITCAGRSSAGYCLTINADANNPGGITAAKKSCVYYNKGFFTTTKDRPIILINGGEFNGSTVISSYSKNGGTNCPLYYFNGGTFNGDIALTKAMLRIGGGLYNGYINCSGDQTAYRLIWGGTFKNFQFMTADSTNLKFWIGTSMGNSDVGVYIDKNGYLVVGGPVIESGDDRFEARADGYGNWGDYLSYSSAANVGLYYESLELALSENKNSKVEVLTDVVDLTKNTTFEGTLNIPEGATEFNVVYQQGATPAWNVGTESENMIVIYTDTAISTLAADSTGVVVRNYTVYETLEQAISDAQNGDTITLLSNVDITESVVIPANKTIILDLNGYTISQVKECTASYEMISNKGNLTITGNGKISFTDTSAGDASASWGAYTIRNEGTLVIENGTIENLSAQNVAGGSFAHTTIAIFQYSGSCTINGGTISCPSYRSVRLWKGEMVINGGAFVGQVWVQCVDETAKLTISGGEFTNTWNDASSVFVGNVDDSGKLHNVEVAITNGTFNGKVGCNNATAVAGAITGGTFSAKAAQGTNTALLAKGYKLEENASGTYDVNRNIALTDVFTFTGYSVKENGTAIVASFNVDKKLFELYAQDNNVSIVFGSYLTAYEMTSPAVKTELSSYGLTSTYNLIVTDVASVADVPFILAMYIEINGETSYLSANGIGDASTVPTVTLNYALTQTTASVKEEE